MPKLKEKKKAKCEFVQKLFVECFCELAETMAKKEGGIHEKLRAKYGEKDKMLVIQMMLIKEATNADLYSFKQVLSVIEEVDDSQAVELAVSTYLKRHDLFGRAAVVLYCWLVGSFPQL